MPPKDSLQVQSFHINVGAGDGAIHLLTRPWQADDKKNYKAPNNRLFIVQAFLVDGGPREAADLIENLVNRIEASFNSAYMRDDGTCRLLFNGIVITHWDNDHYGGLEKYLTKEIGTFNYGDNESKSKYCIIPALYNKTTGNPCTFIYSPCAWPRKSKFELNTDGTQLNLKLTTGLAAGLFRVRTGYEDLIGRNLFCQYSEPIDNPVADLSSVKDFNTLVTKNPIQRPDLLSVDWDALPALYCIAAERMLLGSTKALHTDTNMSSIILIIVWKVAETGNKKKDYRISHYFAGDAHSPLEEDVYKWIGREITTMKLSHHGAATSNPDQALRKYNPKNVVVSAGAQYGHPRWEVLSNMDAWWKEKTMKKGYKGPKPLYFCQWPYYLSKNKSGEFVWSKIGIGELTKAIKEGLRIIDEKRAADAMKNIKSKDSDLTDLFNDERGQSKKGGILNPKVLPSFKDFLDKDKIEKNELLKKVIGFLGNLSALKEGGVVCGHKIGGPATESILMDKLLCVRIICDPLESKDGKVKMLGSADGTALTTDELNINSNSVLQKMTQDVPNNCSIALRAAKLKDNKAIAWDEDDNDEDDDWYVDMHPNKGFDQAMVIDLTNGNPNWNSFRKKYDNRNKHQKDDEELNDENRNECNDWVDLDESSSLASFGSRRASSSTTFSEVGSALVTARFNPRVQLQEISNKFRALAAKVYLTCQDEANPGRAIKIPKESTPCVLDPGHALAGFLNTLHFHSIGLTDIPDTVKSIPVDSNDEMYQWLAMFCGWDPESMPVPAGFSLGMRKVPEWPLKDSMLKSTPLDFEIMVPFTSILNFKFSTDDGAKLTFSKIYGTDPDPASKTQAGESRGVTPEALNQMLEYRRMLVFGLEKLKDPITITLKDLATFMKIDILNNPLVKILTDGINLILDTDKDFHNAIWFRPSLSYETHMRLQFHIETPEVFNKWLHTLNDNLNVDALWVIGRKKATWMWSNPKDQIVFESSLTFLCLMSISPTRQLEGIFKLDENSVKLTLTLNEKAVKKQSVSMKTMGASGLLDELIDWLSTVFGVSNKEDFNNVIKQATASETGIMDDSSIIPRRVEVTLGLDSQGRIAGVRGVNVDIEACLTIGRPAVAVAEEMPAVFLFTFAWSEGLGLHLMGRLWTVIPDTPFTPYDRALPEFEEYEYLKPVSPVLPENQLRTIDIARLLSDKKGEVKNLPAGIPNEIYVCEIFLSQEKVAFKGSLRCSQPLAGNPSNSTPPPPMPPTISLENVALQASYTWGTKSPSEKGFEMSLAISIALYLGEYDEYESMDAQNAAAAKLTGLVKYDKGDWTIEAAVYDLSILHLLQFWDLDDRGPISAFLGKINIDFVKVAYEFKNGKTSTGAYIDDGKDVKSPSRLTINGQFTIANVVGLSFEYINAGGDGWTLKAGLGASEMTKDTATVGGLLSGFMDELVVNALPEAIRGAKIPGGSDTADKKALQLLVAKKKGTSVFALLVNIGAVSVWFIQIRRGPKEPVKRILKAAISKVSVNVPAFQTTINSPWEDLFFMWVQDQTVPKEGADALMGITQTEYDHMAELLKEKLKVKEEELHLFKPAAKKEPDPKTQRHLQRLITAAGDEKGDNKDPEASKVVMPAGFHLVIVAKKPDGNAGVILDYLFGTKKKKPASSKTYETYNALIPPEKQPKKELDASGSEKGTKAPFKVKLGPLSVGNVGLWFREGMIGITLDASLIMGPLGFSLLGFSIGVPFSKGYSLANPPPLSAVEWGLKGLILAMDKPPLTIAGGFMRDTSDPKVEVMYTGGIIVGFKPWSFEAMGAYATVKKDKDASGKWITTINTRPLHQFTLESLTNDSDEAHDGQLVKVKGNADTFTFAFIYVKLNGPLFSVGFADIAGVVGGFGINSDISLPTVEQVTSFPFVAERDSSEKVSPAEKIQSLMDGSWFRPAEGMYWAAAGARVTAFQMLAANIVLVLQFGNGNLLFGIFGVATCDVPALEAPVKFAHVELGIVCTFDVASGIFKFEAQLSPRSFILSPQCHLTGGMALFSWTKSDRSDKDSKNWISAGDWVLTIGGYHRAFSPPKQYPNPPRLGISWSLSSCLSVKGEAYFAITPKVCMGGGKIRAALSLGPLYAWFDAFMDFLMNFEPFFFQMSARVSVGVRFTLDLWLVTIRISVEISAGLDLTGPPFGGVVHVDFWVFGFDIKLGSSPPPPPAISLARFWSVATKTGSSSTSSQGLLSAPPPQPDTAAILLTCETGLLPPAQAPKTKSSADSNPQDSKWYVRGGKFALLATFQCPVTEAKLKETRIQKTEAGETEEFRGAECTILDQYKKVYAKPMQLYTPLTSAVGIAVKAPRPKMKMQDVHTLESWADQKWKLTAQTKPVETSIWGQYNMNEDPTRVKGPIEGLLDGKNATMQLVTGISIVPPDPAMAGDKINKFNVTKDHMEAVFQPGQKEWPLFIDVLKDQDQSWAPRERSTNWCEVKKAWAKVGDDTTSKAVDLWAKRMRYDKQSFDADQKDESSKKTFKPLRGVSPKKLVDKFELLVPALPLIAVG